MKLRRLRDGDILEDGDVPQHLRRLRDFAVRDATVEELAQQAPLVRLIA